MRAWIIGLGGVALGLLCMISTAQAVEAGLDRAESTTKKFETTYGKALPPIGYVEMCGREPEPRLSVARLQRARRAGGWGYGARLPVG